MELNCFNPFSKRNPHLLQQKMLMMDFVDDKISFYHYSCGRGSGKSVGVCVSALYNGMRYPGIRILILSPTNRKLRDNIISIWEEIVPEELYYYKSSIGKISLPNGSEILLRSRSIDNSKKNADYSRGLSVNLIFDDECGEGFNKKSFNNSMACIRRPGPKGYITTSTPTLNDYAELISNKNHNLSVFPTHVNKYLPISFTETLRENMSPSEYKREVLGQFVELGSKIWPDFIHAPLAQQGNLTDLSFIPGKEFVLSMDIGSANSSFLIWQDFHVFGLERNVVVGEYHPTKSEDGSVRRTLERVKNDFGIPARVICGNDIVTRSAGDNLNGIFFIRNIFGDVPIAAPKGALQRDKQVQYDCTSSLILNGLGYRRFLVSQNLRSYDPDLRGIIATMQNDAFSERRDETCFFPKGNHCKLEHCRDALLYGIVCYYNPPGMQKTNFWEENYSF